MVTINIHLATQIIDFIHYMLDQEQYTWEMLDNQKYRLIVVMFFYVNRVLQPPISSLQTLIFQMKQIQ